MRKLQGKDLFKFMQVISKARGEAALLELIEKIGDFESELEAGTETALVLLDVFSSEKIEPLFYEFLSGPLEMSSKEVEEMHVAELIEKIIQIVKENDVEAFFTFLLKEIKGRH